MNENTKLEKRIDRIERISLICLAISFVITCVVWASSFVSITGNVIKFGTIDIDVGYYDASGAKHYYQEGESLFNSDPADSENKLVRINQEISKEIFIENKGGLDAYYTVFFDNIVGEFGEELLVTIKDKDTGATLLPKEGSSAIRANDLTKEKREDDDRKKIDAIEAYATKDIIISLKYSPSNKLIKADENGMKFEFDLCIEAVQKRNNP